MLKCDELEIDKIAFDEEYQGYRFKATYLKKPKGEALIEITKEGDVVKEFLFPSYKIWNIAAHASDIVLGLEQDSEEGLQVAGSTGLGGNVYTRQ